MKPLFRKRERGLGIGPAADFFAEPHVDRILGTYLHGLFDSPSACAALLSWAGLKDARGQDYALPMRSTVCAG